MCEYTSLLLYVLPWCVHVWEDAERDVSCTPSIRVAAVHIFVFFVCNQTEYHSVKSVGGPRSKDSSLLVVQWGDHLHSSEPMVYNARIRQHQQNTAAIASSSV